MLTLASVTGQILGHVQEGGRLLDHGGKGNRRLLKALDAAAVRLRSNAAAEVFWPQVVGRDVRRRAVGSEGEAEGLKMRYVPMLPELAGELRRFPAVIGEDRIFPPKPGAMSGRQRVEGSFDDLLDRAGIKDFRFHDLRHTTAAIFMSSRRSWATRISR